MSTVKDLESVSRTTISISVGTLVCTLWPNFKLVQVLTYYEWPHSHSELRLFTLGIFRNLISHQIFTFVLIVRKINLNFAFNLLLLNHWPAIYNWWNFYHSQLPSKSRISRQIDCIWLLQISSWERVPKEIIFQWTIIFFGTYSSAKKLSNQSECKIVNDTRIRCAKISWKQRFYWD